MFFCANCCLQGQESAPLSANMKQKSLKCIQGRKRNILNWNLNEKLFLLLEILSCESYKEQTLWFSLLLPPDKAFVVVSQKAAFLCFKSCQTA